MAQENSLGSKSKKEVHPILVGGSIRLQQEERVVLVTCLWKCLLCDCVMYASFCYVSFGILATSLELWRSMLLFWWQGRGIYYRNGMISVVYIMPLVKMLKISGHFDCMILCIMYCLKNDLSSNQCNR